MWNLEKNGTNELVYKTEIESPMQGEKKNQLYIYQGGKGQRDKLGDWD